MGWWRGLRWRQPRDETQEEARAAAAMARLLGQCGVAAGECVPWNDQGDEKGGGLKTVDGATGDERR